MIPASFDYVAPTTVADALAHPVGQLFGGFPHDAGERNDRQPGANEESNVIVPCGDEPQPYGNWHEYQQPIQRWFYFFRHSATQQVSNH